MDHFFAIKFYIYFSGNPPNVGRGSIFAGSKTLQKVMKITHFDTLRGPSVHLEQVFRRVQKIMQNYAKMHLKSPQNEHEKTCRPVLQWSKTHAVAWPAKMHQIALIFGLPGVALLTPWMQKLFKIVENSSHNDHKNARPGVALVKNTRRRLTCENV